MFSQLLDGIAAVEEFAPLAVDVADVGDAAGSAHEARVVCEHVCFGQQCPDVQQARAQTALQDG